MAAFRLEEVATIAGGSVLQGSPPQVFRSFGIDSRIAVPGELFFALPGKRDGHDFVRDAAGKGAAGAVVSRPVAVPDPAFGLVETRDTVAAGWKGRAVTFGLGRSCDVRASDIRRRGYEGSDLTLGYGREEGRVLVPFINEALVPNLLAAAAGIAGIVRPGDLVLVKGSRGMRTDKVVAGLRTRGKE